MYMIYIYIYGPGQQPPPPPMSWSWSHMYAVCRRIYVRYSLHTPPTCGMVCGAVLWRNAPCPPRGYPVRPSSSVHPRLATAVLNSILANEIGTWKDLEVTIKMTLYDII